jgi:hypothetical protein
MAKEKPAKIQELFDDTEIGAIQHTEQAVSLKQLASDHRVEGVRYNKPKLVPIDDLRPSDFNARFDDCKSAEYWDRLRADIVSKGEITTPLLAKSDNTLISGHSRLQIAKELKAAGDKRFDRILVRYIDGVISEADERVLVYGDNINRFEIDPDTRIVLYAEMYPDVFRDQKQGRPGREDPSNRLKAVARETGRSEAAIKKDRELIQKAFQIAGDLDATLTPALIQAARTNVNEKRRDRKTRSKRKKPAKVRSISFDELQERANSYIAEQGDAGLKEVFENFIAMLMARDR